MNPLDETRDEEQLAGLLHAAETGTPPPDRDALARLRAQSADAYLAASARERNRRMFASLARWSTLAAAAAVILAVTLSAFLNQGAKGAPLGEVLAQSEAADTLRLRLAKGDEQLEAWYTSKPARSRWDDLAGKYRIVEGKEYWLVDEKANVAKRGTPPKHADRPLQLALDLLGLPADRDELLRCRPLERARDGDVDVFVYRCAIPRDGGKVLLEALVLAEQQRLHSLSVRFEKGGKVNPVGSLTVLAYDEPVGAEKFAIAETLTDDGRIGKAGDVQGVVTLRPAGQQRWTPVREGMVLRPGDQVRTDARGANATALRLVKQTGLVLGPRTLVELLGPAKVRFIEGEVEVTPSPGSGVALLGPDGKKVAVKDRQLYRARKGQLARVEKDPPWLLGFKGATADSALGSLVALVDGRNVPLTVGYHKVSVDIRDQIARTVIEESFVNHTDTELEGVFYFPLPQDASISGFGMWIGDNLVEADVVEKQRAREIYETILRERRDPALLEWSGGNLFKARVFPIPANSEKRIKISYTQVLPLKGGRYRYSYALQSELLRQHPLRELTIDVRVSSAIPLKSVTSPTHPTRNEETAHAARVKFTAQEYVPSRDFEVVVETEGRRSDVVMIPHRRGDDGYFMLQLTPPGSAADGDRAVLPDGEPLELLILADTSASIDASQRATQATFVAALLSSLSPKDVFNLATCDVTTEWAFLEPAAASEKSSTAARDFLARRGSLGWTDLDAAFASAMNQAGPRTHVIYVGDAIPTTKDADPVALTNRLRRLHKGAATFHAVSLGSTYESGVLKAIASLGAGSVRKITGEQGPASVARELLAEIAVPGLRDIKVEFRGLRAARVYPERLANVPAGTQQILMGRYLPEGRDQAGEVVVTGTQAGKPVRFSTAVSLKDAEQGNSFLPRLWARMHVDSLLDQGTNDVVRDEIIALSEEFHIITPYTSLLVLETDADRERFKVKRRFQMRDGERFFADGRDQAVFDLTQKQMKKAGAYRTALRRSILTELSRLGREPRLFQPAGRHPGYFYRLDQLAKQSKAIDETFAFDDGEVRLGGLSEATPGNAPLGELGMPLEELADRMERDKDKREDGLEFNEFASKAEQAAFGPEAKAAASEEPAGGAEWSTAPASPASDLDLGRLIPDVQQANTIMAEEELDGLFHAMDGKSSEFGSALGGRYPGRRGPRYGAWLSTLFPTLSPTPSEAKEPKTTWPAPARELARSLLRTDELAKLSGGVEITRQTDTLDPRWGDVTGRSRRLELAAAKSWLTRSESDGGPTLVAWCDGKELGVYSKAFQLGRVRAAVPRDVQPPPLELGDHSLLALDVTHADHEPTLEPQGKDRTLLTLKHPTSPEYETRLLIDTTRHVVVSIETRHKDNVTGKTTFDDFVKVAGSWWARKSETTNDDGKVVSRMTQAVKATDDKELAARVKTELAGRDQVQLVRMPVPTVMEAKRAQAAGKARFDDQLVLLLHFHNTQQWPRVLEHLQQAEKLAAGKPGVRWLRSALLRDSRRNEELRLRYLDDAARLAKGAGDDQYYLAEYVLGQSSGVLQANEMLALLDALRPLYGKHPAHVRAMQRWHHLRVSYLRQAERPDEALAVLRQLATDYPRVYSLQYEYANALASAGDYPAAYAWLNKAMTKEAKWLDYEEEALRSSYAELLRQQGRFADLADYLAPWVEKAPPARSAFEQYLSALLKADQVEKAEALAFQWLKDAQVPGPLSPAAEARLHAAVNYLLGHIYHVYSNHIEERWREPLARAALYFARHDTAAWAAEQIVSHHRFRHGEEATRLRKAFASILTTEMAKLPAGQIQRLVGWVQPDDAGPAAWEKAVAVLRQRWANEGKEDVKHVLGQALVSLLPRHGGPDEPLAFMRVQWKTGPEKYRPAYARQLFQHLLEQPWTEALEAEAFTLLDRLGDPDDEPGRRLLSAVTALHQITDRVVESRHAARMKALEKQEKLTRIELRKKQDESRRAAREGLADRLRKEAAKHPKALAKWLVAEGLYLDLLLDRNLKLATAEAWEAVGDAPKKPADEPSIEHALDSVLRQRYLVTLMNLAARKGADPALVERLTKYVDRALAEQPDDPRWKATKYRLLIALDRPKDLEALLQAWSRGDSVDSRWRVALGYLLAEQGRVADAVREFEAVEAADELTPAGYRTLSDWYLVLGQREQHERSAAAVYRTAAEHRLSQAISVKLQPWHRRDSRLPTELDKEVLRMFAVLFEKSSSPQSYLYQLQQFYQASHDFRLLAVLADSVVGHTAARVYPFVQGMHSVLEEVRDEAAADELVKRIDEARARAKTDVDKRALDLLEVLVERRAAELTNQPGPHRDRALAALVRASKNKWSPGEPPLMAEFLLGLGRITQAALADEQLRQLKKLHGESERGTADALYITHRYALTLDRYQRRAEAIDLLQAALDEVQTANKGVLPVSANNPLASFVGLLQDARHFARGEKVLFAQLGHPAHDQQRRWLAERLNELYHQALSNDGEVSLGKGAGLYKALIAKVQKDLADRDQNHRYQLVYLLTNVYGTAHHKKLPGAAADLKAFAFEALPPILKEQTNNHESIVGHVAQTLHEVAGPRDAIAFVLNQIEREPRWLRYNNQDGWQRHGSALAEWRREAKDLGDVEGRLLKLVLSELRRDLESRESRNRVMYHQHSDRDRFWKAKADEFAKVAEAVLTERPKSGATAQHVAEYFFWGLDRPGRAIDVLLAAHARELLDDAGQVQLVDYLHRQERFAESVPVLRPLVGRRPENIEYRVLLMRAYVRTGDQEDLLALLKETDTFFHQKDRWTPQVMHRLAESTLENELYEQSVAYFRELIPLHERTHPGRGVGDGALANYYTGLATAYAGLKKTPEAVDAAGAAIVAWGRHGTQRAQALDTLRRVLLLSPDLDAYVARLDRQKEDSAIIRKALGQAYREKKEHAKAIKQLEIAAELQPNDVEIHQALVAAHDAAGDREGALTALLRAVQLSRRELKLFQDLGDRFQAAGDPAGAERAFTSIVEALPTESESHALLAEVREKQGRWGEAIEHWQQVARIRALEPTGLLKLAAAQIQAKQWDDARATLRKLESRTWPPRFDDVRQQVRTLEERLEKSRKGPAAT